MPWLYLAGIWKTLTWWECSCTSIHVHPRIRILPRSTWTLLDNRLMVLPSIKTFLMMHICVSRCATKHTINKDYHDTIHITTTAANLFTIEASEHETGSKLWEWKKTEFFANKPVTSVNSSLYGSKLGVSPVSFVRKSKRLEKLKPYKNC